MYFQFTYNRVAAIAPLFEFCFLVFDCIYANEQSYSCDISNEQNLFLFHMIITRITNCLWYCCVQCKLTDLNLILNTIYSYKYWEQCRERFMQHFYRIAHAFFRTNSTIRVCSWRII